MFKLYLDDVRRTMLLLVVAWRKDANSEEVMKNEEPQIPTQVKRPSFAVISSRTQPSY